VVVVAVVVIVAAVLLPVWQKPKRITRRVTCVSNLKEIGVGFRIWEGDHDGRCPLDVAAALGGAQELIATGNVAGCFQVMSNEISATKILICPEDSQHESTTNWSRLSRFNVSYFIGLNATNSISPNVLPGDANLLCNGLAVPPGKLNLLSNSVSWTKDRHGGQGNILLSDGSVQTVTRMGFTSMAGTFYAANCVVVP
jgi:prepilin-type processing-associated H-X9-DG protein